jgi:apolipoprotein N-acyltransferase
MLPGGTRVGALICWESAFDDLARTSVAGGAQVLAVLTDDGWFGRSAASAQQNATAILRAAENRVPVVIASNTGPSLVIDASGRVVRSAPEAFVESVVVGDVRPGTGRTPYTRFGNVLVFLSILGLLAAATPILRLVATKRSSR